MNLKRTSIALSLAMTSLLSLTACQAKNTPGNAPGQGQAMESVPADDQMMASDFTASESSLGHQDKYEFPGLGLNFTLPQSLQDQAKNLDLGLFTDEMPDSKNPKELGHAQVLFKAMNDQEKKAVVKKVGTEYEDWFKGLKPLGALGVYKASMKDQLDELTSCDQHKILGESPDKQYIYVQSINSKADPAFIQDFQKTQVTLSQMEEYDGISAFYPSGLRKNVANIAPFKTVDINGKEFSSDQLSKNKLTMVNVFATWCGPCVKEIPELAKLHQDLADKGFGVIGVVTDTGEKSPGREESLEKAKLIQDKTKASYPFLVPDKGQMNGRLDGIDAMPETFFVDSQGNIVGDTYSGAHSYDEWKAIVEKEMAKLDQGK